MLLLKSMKGIGRISKCTNVMLCKNLVTNTLSTRFKCSINDPFKNVARPCGDRSKFHTCSCEYIPS